MTDYKELIDELRTCAEMGWFAPCEMQNAADAIEQLTKERDAAIEDLKIAGDCHSCLHNKRENLDGICNRCFFLSESCWEWRGVNEEKQYGD